MDNYGQLYIYIRTICHWIGWPTLGPWGRPFRSTTAQLTKRTWPEAAEKLITGEVPMAT